MKEIKQIHSYLKSREDYYKQKIEELQENCPHEDVVVKRGANTDNWDYKDYYWVVVKCSDYGMVARFDRENHPEEYKKYIRLKINMEGIC